MSTFWNYPCSIEQHLPLTLTRLSGYCPKLFFFWLLIHPLYLWQIKNLRDLNPWPNVKLVDPSLTIAYINKIPFWQVSPTSWSSWATDRMLSDKLVDKSTKSTVDQIFRSLVFRECVETSSTTTTATSTMPKTTSSTLKETTTTTHKRGAEWARRPWTFKELSWSNIYTDEEEEDGRRLHLINFFPLHVSLFFWTRKKRTIDGKLTKRRERKKMST